MNQATVVVKFWTSEGYQNINQKFEIDNFCDQIKMI